MTISEIVLWARLAVKLLSKLRLRFLIRWIREYAVFRFFVNYHLSIIHEMRKFSILLLTHKPQDLDKANEVRIKAAELCTQLALTVRRLSDDDTISCCLKLFDSDSKKDRVLALGRSEPNGDRADAMDNENVNFVTKNTKWCALLGLYDNQVTWKKYNCFVCNDLFEVGEKFKCDVQSWRNYYRSILVFTLRFVEDTSSNQKVIGFLQFDSPNKDAFRGFPNIFDYQYFKDPIKGRDQYNRKLKEKGLFHYGASVADSLSMFIRPYYLTLNNKGKIR